MEYVGEVILGVVALVPVIGAVKHIDTVSKLADDVGDIGKVTSKTLKQIDNATDIIADGSKHTDELTDTIKDNISNPPTDVFENTSIPKNYHGLINNRFPGEPQNGKSYNYIISDGKILTNATNKKIDFIIDKNYNLKIGSGHAYLSDGDSVLAAGKIKINSSGYLRTITNESGHYTPSQKHAETFPEIFDSIGVRTKNTWLGSYKHTLDDYGYVNLNRQELYFRKLK